MNPATLAAEPRRVAAVLAVVFVGATLLHVLLGGGGTPRPAAVVRYADIARDTPAGRDAGAPRLARVSIPAPLVPKVTRKRPTARPAPTATATAVPTATPTPTPTPVTVVATPEPTAAPPAPAPAPPPPAPVQPTHGPSFDSSG